MAHGERWRWTTLLLVLSLVAMLVGGCTMTRAPELHVRDASIVGHGGDAGTDEAQHLMLEVVLENPTTPREATTASGSGGAVRLLEVHYQVRRDGRAVYQGRADARATLAAGSRRTMTLPIVVTLRGDIEGSRDQVAGGAVGAVNAGAAGGPGAGSQTVDPQTGGFIDGTTLRISGHVRYLPDDRLSEILADLGLRHRRARFSGEARVK